MSVKDQASMKGLIRSYKGMFSETREVSSDDGRKVRQITGFIPYGKASEDLGGFIEFIDRGAFTKTLKESNVRCLWNHEARYCLGNTANSMLVFEDREDGLHFAVSMPDTAWANDLYESVSRRDVNGVSFGFDAIADEWDDLDKSTAKRYLKEVRLYEVSVGVTFPAYPDSDSEASMRALGIGRGIDFEKLALALGRAKGKETIEERDVELVKSSIDALSKLLPEESRTKPEGEPGSPTPVEPPDGTLARQRELDLMEAEQGGL